MFKNSILNKIHRNKSIQTLPKYFKKDASQYLELKIYIYKCDTVLLC